MEHKRKMRFIESLARLILFIVLCAAGLRGIWELLKLGWAWFGFAP